MTNILPVKYLLFFYCSFISALSFAQKGESTIYRIHSSNTSFPDTARAKGHQYNKIFYDAATHYLDSSILLIVPTKINTSKKIDLVFWFHGWQNNIDSAAKRFELIKQFEAAYVNSILVLAETARNAPDSYGGKLEYNNTFKQLVADILEKLKKEKVISKKTRPGNILLAGHSGAYRVMAYILANGNLPVQEVILFDALYGQTDKFMDWIQSDKRHRFINIYTNGGGTDIKSKEMFNQLVKLNINTNMVEEKDLTAQLLYKEKIIFIHSLHLHNDVINKPDNFQLFLINSSFLKKLKE